MSAARWINRWSLGFAAALALLILLVLRNRVPESDEARQLQQASMLLAEERFEEAGTLAERVVRKNVLREETLMLLGRAGARLKRTQPSYRRRHCDPPPAADASVERLFDHADRLLDAGRIREAEQALRRVLALDSHHQDANHNLAMLLRFENRCFEARPYLLELYRQGRFRREYLHTSFVVENFGSTPGVDGYYLKVCRAADPEDVLPLLNAIRIEQHANDPQAMLPLLKLTLERDPDLAEVQARLGWFLLKAGTDADFVHWNASLGPAADDHPLTWAVRGLYAQRHGDKPGAIRCFLRGIELDPCHRLAFYQLSLLFRAVGETARAEACASRAKRIEQYEALLGTPPLSLEQIQETIELAESLERWWEALGWAHRAVLLFPEDQTSPKLVTRLQAKVSPETPLCDFPRDAAWNIPPAEYPLPDWKSLAANSKPESPPAASEMATRFSDKAESMGVDFVFHNGADPSSGTAYMFELSGGGVGVLDYDSDGWPDLHLSQGCRWPVDPHDHSRLDRLFRNRNGKRFEDVTRSAGIVENGLSQSVSVGDYNADGFQDVYIGNIGPNRLWLNNGDGTFDDATDAAGIAGNDWTASAAFGDLDGDGLQDLYVVNYLSGPEVYTRTCFHEGDGKTPIQCSPLLFPSAQDRLYQNLGDGRFADVTDESGIAVPNGKGLAVVIADFNNSRRLNLFVANDTTANFYFANQTEGPGRPMRFHEQAVLSGLAYDGRGRATSNMGVAAGDANQDGLLDLFVTNFYREVNHFYLQQPGDVFVEAIQESGMAEPGFPVMGWGAQFLDGDLDGREDLFVANGSLYPPSPPYQMPQHYFQNQGQGRFVLAPPETLGLYFMNRWLGRAVARLDVNRDGLPDLAITHVDTPFVLLVNENPRHGRFLKVRLRGVTSEREAIGATVRVTANDKVWSRQLVGGDGFAASNERVLIFGLRDAEQIDNLAVSWPSGAEDVYSETIPVDSEVLLVEGAPRIVQLHPSASNPLPKQ